MTDTTTTTTTTVTVDALADLMARAKDANARLFIRAELRAEEVKRYQVKLNRENRIRVTMRAGVKQAGEFTYETAISLLVEALRDGLIGLGASAALMDHVGALVLVPVMIAVMAAGRTVVAHVREGGEE